MENKSIKVDFIGIGAQKAATTWIFKCLQEHPEICVSEPKETFFFCDNQKFEQGLNLYNKYFNDCPTESVKGEYSTEYLPNEKVPARIKKYFPEVKIIACLRNPVTRAISNYHHLKTKNKSGDFPPFKKILKQHPEIIERGLYYKYLKNYFENFPKQNILIMIYEDIDNDPLKFIKTIYNFLGVEENFIPKGISSKINTTAARMSNINKYINQLYLKHKDRFYGKISLKIARKMGLNKYLLDSVFKINKKNPAISAEDFSWLRDIYAEDIKNLEILINRTLDPWNKIT